MNRRLVLAGPLLLLLGCVSNNPAAPDTDGGGLIGEDSAVSPVDGTAPTDSGLDASIPETSTTDSGAQDTGADAADAGPLPVTLTVTNDVGPEPGVAIVFQSAAGAITGTATTNAAGTVSAVLAANSQVTAIFSNGSSQALLTIQGVEPGDVLTAIDTLNEGYPIPGGSNVSILSVPDASSPDAAADAAAIMTYAASAGTCTGSSATLPLPLSVGFPCEVGGKFPLLVRGLDVDGVEVAYTYQKGNLLPDAGSSGTLDLSLDTPWATDEMTQTLSATNVVNGNNWFVFTELAGGVGSPILTSYGATSEDGGPLSASGSATLHLDYAEAVQAESTHAEYSGDFTLYQSIASRINAPDGAPSQFDMSQSLPQITYSTIDTTDAGTPSSPALTWASAAPLATADGLILVVPGTLQTDAGSTNVSWTIVAPATATSVTPPTLPGSIGAWTALSYEPVDVIAIEASFIAGYAQFRTVAGALPTSNTVITEQQGALVPPLPVEGTLRMTAIGQGD